MQPDELDRLLRDEVIIDPSVGFADAVMSEIRREAETPPRIAFPWRPVVGGLISATIGVAAALSVGLTRSTPIAGAQWNQLVAWSGRWTTELASAGATTMTGSLALALMCSLVPMAVYELTLRFVDRAPRHSAKV
jgi:hypothetical protein